MNCDETICFNTFHYVLHATTNKVEVLDLLMNYKNETICNYKKKNLIISFYISYKKD